MKDQIEKLKKEKKALKDRLEKINMAISALRDVCHHKFENGESAWQCTGYDSHSDHYECQICGAWKHI